MRLLSGDEMRLWHAWKVAGDAVMGGVGRDIAAGTKLSATEYAVVSRLADLGQGELRQQELAAAIAWDKSRLSHQLTRMERRGFVRRRAAGGKGVIVALTAAGTKALADARPAHAHAIRKHLLAKLSPGRRRALLAICETLAAE